MRFFTKGGFWYVNDGKNPNPISLQYGADDLGKKMDENGNFAVFHCTLPGSERYHVIEVVDGKPKKIGSNPMGSYNAEFVKIEGDHIVFKEKENGSWRYVYYQKNLQRDNSIHPTPVDAPESSRQVNTNQYNEQSEADYIRQEPMSQKSWTGTYWRCLLGFFLLAGEHRFYLKKNVTGFLMLITLGGGGIWTLIDLVFLSLDKFKDSDGNYILRKNKLISVSGILSIAVVITFMIIWFMAAIGAGIFDSGVRDFFIVGAIMVAVRAIIAFIFQKKKRA